ncbi:MAG: hypothetical protein R2725_07430 [Solirubrobacterales bacterium]
MISLRLTLPVRNLAIATALCFAASLIAAGGAHAYVKPAGGKWNFQNLFDDTQRGAMSLSKDGNKLTKLVLVPGEGASESCRTEPIRLQTKPAVKRYRKVGGRYAVANLNRKTGLFVGKPMVFKQGTKRFRAKLHILWDEDGRVASTGRYERGDCTIAFFARKGR